MAAIWQYSGQTSAGRKLQGLKQETTTEKGLAVGREEQMDRCDRGDVAKGQEESRTWIIGLGEREHGPATERERETEEVRKKDLHTGGGTIVGTVNSGTVNSGGICSFSKSPSC